MTLRKARTQRRHGVKGGFVVRLLVIADETVESLWRPQVRRLAPDLVIAAGDLPWDYLEFMASATDVPTIFVPGNHDLPLRPVSHHRRSGLMLDSGVPVDSPRPRGAVNIDTTVLDVAGLRIAGLGGCVRYRPGPHQYTQREYFRRAKTVARAVRRLQRRRPGRVDVLVTHAPPLGLGDEQDRPHFGIEALHPLLAQLRPTWLLHGHIHPHGRQLPDRVVHHAEGRTTIRNVIPYRILDVKPAPVLV